MEMSHASQAIMKFMWSIYRPQKAIDISTILEKVYRWGVLRDQGEIPPRNTQLRISRYFLKLWSIYILASLCGFSMNQDEQRAAFSIHGFKVSECCVVVAGVCAGRWWSCL
jgi:hypothetical protein